MIKIDNNPYIEILLTSVEKRFGRHLKTPYDFECLSIDIEASCGATLSVSTLKRIWGYVSGYNKSRSSTLDILSKFAGYKGFDDFVDCNKMNSKGNDILEYINTYELQIGDLIEIGWSKNQQCIIEYIGYLNFRVSYASEKCSLNKNDTFFCSLFTKDKPLVLDNLKQGHKAPVRFEIGNKEGITILKKIKY